MRLRVRDVQFQSTLRMTETTICRFETHYVLSIEVSSQVLHTLSSTLHSTFPCPRCLHFLQMCLYLHFSAEELHPFAPLNQLQISDFSPDFPLFFEPVLLPSLAVSAAMLSGATMVELFTSASHS